MEKPVDVAVLLNAERKTDDNSCEVEFRIINEDILMGTVLAHKTVLKARSPVFKQQFFGPMKRTDCDREKVIVKGCTFDGFYSIMECIYGNLSYLDQIKDFSILFDVLKLADKYDLQDVFSHILHMIRRYPLDEPSQLLFVLRVVYAHKDLENLSEICEYTGRRAADVLINKLRYVNKILTFLSERFHEAGNVMVWFMGHLKQIEKTPVEEAYEAAKKEKAEFLDGIQRLLHLVDKNYCRNCLSRTVRFGVCPSTLKSVSLRQQPPVVPGMQTHVMYNDRCYIHKKTASGWVELKECAEPAGRFYWLPVNSREYKAMTYTYNCNCPVFRPRRSGRN